MNLTDYEHLVPEVVLHVNRRASADWEIVSQQIPFHDLTLIVGGQACYWIDNVKYEVGPGNLVYVAPGSLRAASTSASDPVRSLAFNFILHAPEQINRLPFPTISSNQASREIMEHMQEFNRVWLGMRPGYRLQARGLFLLILHRLLTLSIHQEEERLLDPRIVLVTEYINEHYASDLTLEWMAELVQLHPVYLGQLFKAHMKLSVKQYLNLVRINQAEIMLSKGGLTVTETAAQCGFRDISYFSHVFKSIKGYTPSTASSNRFQLF